MHYARYFACRKITLALVPPIFSLSEKIGGAEEDRTPDPLLAKQVLSQLSYSPLNFAPRLRSESLDFMVYHERATKLRVEWWAQEDSDL